MPSKEEIVRILKEPGFRDLPIPRYATSGSAGVDLYAAVESRVIVPARSWRLISTGIRIALPAGFEAQIRPRSGLALKYGVTMLNSPGTIDSDYRGIIGVILMNHSEEPFEVKRRDRIAQMIIAPVSRLNFEEVSYLRPTVRGEGGFGSSGFSDEDQTDDFGVSRRKRK